MVDTFGQRSGTGHRNDAEPVTMSGRHRRIHNSHLRAPLLLNVCRSFRLTGRVDASLLHAAVEQVSARHDALRTTYERDSDGEVRAWLHATLPPGWAEFDLTDLNGRARELRLEVLAQRAFGSPFDLATDAPLRVTLIRTGQNEHILLLLTHLIAWDDASMANFFADLTAAYCGETLDRFSAGPQWAHYDDAADLAYWRQTMADPPEPLELPGPHGTVVPSGWRADTCRTRLSKPTMSRVQRVADDTATTVDAVLLAAFCALIYRYTHADDFLVARHVLDRGSASEGRIGHYGNGMALRLSPHADQTFAQLLAQVNETERAGLTHQRVNLDQVVADLNPDRRYGVARYPRVGFDVRPPRTQGFAPEGVTCEPADFRGRVAPMPLRFTVEPDAAGATVEAEFLTEVLDAELAAQLLRHYGVLLESALAQPDRLVTHLDLMDARELEWLDAVSSGPAFDSSAHLLGHLVAAQAARTPDAVAVVYENQHYSYRQINDAANRVAHWLIARGIGAEDRVAVRLERSPDLVITALAILKAGGVYLPVDPEYPDDRVDFILADAAPKLVVTEPITDLSDVSSAEPTDADRVRPLLAQNTAYLIYTSGSTGLPKGVPVPHRPVAEYFSWFGDEYQIDESERLLQVASPGFDVSIAEIFGILASGGRLVIPRPGGLRDIGYLTELLRREGITSMHVVPSLLGLFLSIPGVAQWRSLRRVPIGGEALQGDLADKFNATFDAVLHNFYGPAETVINTSRYEVSGTQGNRVVPIGRPKINTAMRILDDSLRPVPVGAIGEIYIGGTHVARGYHGQPGRTSEKFVADPFRPGGRLYRTGDLARRNADGDVEFLGRADEQVKIRGFRAELGKVSAAITVDPSVGQAVVVVDDLPQLGKSLVAYLTPAADHEVDVTRVKARVAAALADYLVPAAYVVLDEIPITAHGKIDRHALPKPDAHAVADPHARGDVTPARELVTQR